MTNAKNVQATVRYVMNLVHIRTEHFESDALYIGEMPAKRVHSIMNDPEPIRRAYRVYLLVRSAILDRNRRIQYDALSYDQANEVIAEYIRSFPVDVPLPSDLRELQ